MFVYLIRFCKSAAVVAMVRLFDARHAHKPAAPSLTAKRSLWIFRIAGNALR